MVAYNFKKEFVEAVETGKKTQTIRALRKGRSRHASPGEALQLYTGMRTNNCKKLLPDPVCFNVQAIMITKDPFVCVVLDKYLLSDKTIEEMAIADGFKSVEAFAAFFDETHGLPFEGVLISWEKSKATEGNNA